MAFQRGLVFHRNGEFGTIVIGVAASFLIATSGALAQSSPQQGAAANSVAAELAKLPPGYLPREALPDSLTLLPPPPVPGSAGMQRDEEARTAAIKLRDTPRFEQAAIDAQIAFPRMPEDFSCAMDLDISEQATPALYGLMARMLTDLGLSTYSAKNGYRRIRPFVLHEADTCYPPDEPLLRNDGSYPSGHSALGWGWALMLAEINPERADIILRRGLDFGQSRLVCDAHWQSDIDAGRVIAAATVARLHGDPVFRSDVDAARAEVAASRRAGMLPHGDCGREAAALAFPK